MRGGDGGAGIRPARRRVGFLTRSDRHCRSRRRFERLPSFAGWDCGAASKSGYMAMYAPGVTVREVHAFLVIQAGEAPLVLGHQHGPEGAPAVPRCALGSPRQAPACRSCCRGDCRSSGLTAPGHSPGAAAALATSVRSMSVSMKAMEATLTASALISPAPYWSMGSWGLDDITAVAASAAFVDSCLATCSIWSCHASRTKLRTGS